MAHVVSGSEFEVMGIMGYVIFLCGVAWDVVIIASLGVGYVCLYPFPSYDHPYALKIKYAMTRDCILPLPNRNIEKASLLAYFI